MRLSLYKILDDMIARIPEGTVTDDMYFRIDSYSRLMMEKEIGTQYKGFEIRPLRDGVPWNIITLCKPKIT